MEHMEDLYVTDCERRPELVGSRGRIVNGAGPGDVNLLFLGKAPGAEEDEGGESFVGRSDSMLDDALRGAGFARADVRTTNCVRCHPPDNHDPMGDEPLNYRGYLTHELKLVDPGLVATLGKVPSQRLFDRGVAITNESGSAMDVRVGDTSYRVLLSVHPTATLYDWNQREGFFEIIARAADLSGLADSMDERTSLGDF